MSFCRTETSDSLMEPLKLSMGVLLLLFPRALSLTGVSALRTEALYVKAGEMAVLHCGGSYPNDTETHWHSDTSQEFNNMSAAELRQMGVVVHGNSLVILSASVNHQGNYSCSIENSGSQSRFALTVYTAQSREYEARTQYNDTCSLQKSYQLNCPHVNIPAVNITSSGTTWRKEDGEPFPEHGYFSMVEEKDSGAYTCTQSYLYDGQIYNMTFRMVLEVQPDAGRCVIHATINSPRMSEVFQVELGSQKEIVCEAITCLSDDGLFWLIGEDFVDTNENLRVFYRNTSNQSVNDIRMMATLVIQKVTEEDLLQNYTCKLESVRQYSSFVTINLTQKARPSYVSLVVCIICCMAVTAVAVVVYVKFKVDITLFLRDTLCWQGSTSDGKSYDAFLMCYESDTKGGLNTQDREWLESVLEDRFGYTLCIYDRDILPGNPVAEAVLNCIEQSRTVVLVPSSPGPNPGSGLLSAIHAALVERQTHLVFINTEPSDVSRSGSLPEALQLLSEAGDHVTWKGMKSMDLSSSFWKQLRYYLPAPQQPPKIKLLPQTVPDVTTQ